MMPESIRADSQVEIHDSCNQCCCFGWKRRDKSLEKAANQRSKIHKQESPRKVERTVTQIHLDATMTDDVEIVMDYKVGPDKE